MFNLRSIVVLNCVFTLFSLSHSYKLENPISDAINITALKDDYEVDIGPIIQENINDVRQLLEIIDPMPLGDIKLQDKGHLKDGWLHKLSNVHRSGKCMMQYSNKVLRMNLNMGWERLHYHYNYEIKLWFVQRYGRLRGSVNKLRFDVTLVANFNNYTLALEHFKVPEIGTLDVDIEGTYGDVIRSLFGKLIVNLTKHQIVKSIETVAANVIEEVFEKINERIPNHERRLKFVNLLNDGNNFV